MQYKRLNASDASEWNLCQSANKIKLSPLHLCQSFSCPAFSVPCPATACRSHAHRSSRTVIRSWQQHKTPHVLVGEGGWSVTFPSHLSRYGQYVLWRETDGACIFVAYDAEVHRQRLRGNNLSEITQWKSVVSVQCPPSPTSALLAHRLPGPRLPGRDPGGRAWTRIVADTCNGNILYTPIISLPLHAETMPRFPPFCMHYILLHTARVRPCSSCHVDSTITLAGLISSLSCRGRTRATRCVTPIVLFTIFSCSALYQIQRT